MRAPSPEASMHMCGRPAHFWPASGEALRATLLPPLVHCLPSARWHAREFIQELRGDIRREAIDIYDHIDKEELRKSYLAHIPQLGV